ncbi:hypothetical protein [Leifsonia sp. 1010]|uniref:hypothetical protein n=1 Tax=Leifsonia sp. 1010 TaxID=2817769 RepID=UPI0028596A34|nr:hypothetical protein [Leifsonia sp. 1010]MDR6612628.1 hypothetical protein [Leifsonia sp. 1010]
MYNSTRRARSRSALLLAGFIAVATLTGCVADSPAPSAKPKHSTSSTSSARPTTKAPTSDADDYKAADWATPIKTGTIIGTASSDALKIDIHQVAIASATNDGIQVDRETKERLLKVGDELVALNFVATNVSSSPIRLVSLLPTVHSDAYPYFGGVPTGREMDWMRQIGVDKLGHKLDPASPKTWVLKPGESFAAGDSYKLYDAPYEVTLKVYPANEDGSLQLESALMDTKVPVTLKR